MDGDVDQEKPNGAGIVVHVHNRELDVSPLHLFGGISSVLPDQAFRSNLLLVLVQEIRRFGIRRHPDGRQQADDNRDDALKEENVLPRVDRMARNSPLGNLGKTGSQQPAKGASDGGRADVDADSKQELFALVKGRQEESHTRHGAALKNTQDGAGAHEAAEVGDEGGAEGDESKTADEKRQVEAGADGFEDDVAGDFKQQVNNVEDG